MDKKKELESQENKRKRALLILSDWVDREEKVLKGEYENNGKTN